MEKFRALLYKVWPYTAMLFAGFAGLRVYEFFHLEPAIRISFGLCLHGMLIDLLFSLLISGMYIALQLLLSAFRLRTMLWIMTVLSLSALLIDFVLIQYFFATKIPLDEAIYFFSIKELRLIVGGENRVSAEVYIVLLTLIAGYFTGIRLLKKVRPNRWFMLAFGLGVLTAVIFPSLSYSDPDKDLRRSVAVNNRLAYFAYRSFLHLNRKEPGQTDIRTTEFSQLDRSFYGGVPVSPEYPLLHQLPGASGLAAHLRTSEKGAPNIVFIIVESLSTTLVGEKGAKTGNLLPFLDSLSRESLYWPNFLSACDRTHNVLPASFASVPYTTKGNMFQQLEFPNHWSMYSLLNNDYYTRFFCGVDLNFSNMNGYMNYYRTDYIVRNWEKQFSGKFSDRETPWGFPDGALFGKSWLDYRKQGLSRQKRLDALLTISTHDPFVIPGEKYYTDLVLQRIAKIRKPTETHRYVKENASKFATFVYLDDQLRRYFEEAKQQPGFDNTIFLIYGDHGTELCLYDDLSRYRIPLIVYSPLIRKPQTFHGVCTQLDIAPTLLNYLRLAHRMKLPATVPFIGKELSFSQKFECDRSVVLGSVAVKESNLLYKDLYLFSNQLYRIRKGMEIVPVANEKLKQEIMEQRRLANLMADYTIYGNKILPLSISSSYTRTEEFRIIYKYSEKRPADKDLAQQFISIGKDVHIPRNTKYVRVRFDCDYWNGHGEKAADLPKLTFSLDRNVDKQGQQLLWKQIDYQQVKALKPKAWNHLSATITVRMSDYQELGKDNLVRYYLLNTGQRTFRIRNVETQVLRDR